jgi:hypothetical protein
MHSYLTALAATQHQADIRNAARRARRARRYTRTLRRPAWR